MEYFILSINVWGHRKMEVSSNYDGKDFDPGTAWRCNMRVALACLLGIELWNQVGLPENKGLHTKNPMVYHHFPRSKLEKEMGVNPPMFRSHLLNSWLPVKCI